MAATLPCRLGLEAAQKAHFDHGGEFDKIYVPKNPAHSRLSVCLREFNHTFSKVQAAFARAP